MDDSQEEQSMENMEYKEVKTKVAKAEATTNTLHVEVLEEEIPATIYIVGAMTVIIIAGAAILFTKINHIPSEHDPEVSDEEMISSTTPDCTDRGWRNMYKLPSYHLYSGSVHKYDKPFHMLSSGHHAPNTGHYAPSNIPDNREALTSYHKLKPIYMQPRYCSY